VFHAAGVERQVRNDIYQGRTPQRYYDALEWLFTAPDYVQGFS
jgi:salicylate hydroxylase